MLFSLILATLNRHKEIEKCLESLRNQICQDFEVIIVDQSEDFLTKDVVSKFESLDIKYHKVGFKGLSKARNLAINYVSGEFLCLLDDDAVYTSDYLSNAKDKLKSANKVILSGKILSVADQKTQFVKYKGNKEILSTSDIIKYCPSAALVIPISAIRTCGGFNERLGVGSRFAAGEETDFLLRLYDNEYRVVYCDNLIAYHPIKPINYRNLKPVYEHAMGKGALAKIDIVQRKKVRLVNFFFRNTIGMIVKAILHIPKKDLSKYYINRMRGFMYGFKHFKEEG